METEISGFYYDVQLLSPEMTVTVHPNTVLGSTDTTQEAAQSKPEDTGTVGGDTANTPEKKDSGGKQEEKKAPVVSREMNWVLCDSKTPGGLLEAVNKKDPNSCAYRKTPLIRAICSEDFQMSIANDWNQFSSGNAIESFYNSNIKPWAPLAGKIGKKLSELKTDASGEWARKITDFANSAGEKMSKIGSALNGALKVQGSQFSYYTGTAASFDNLTIKTTLMSEYSTLFDEKGAVVDKPLEVAKYSTCLQKLEHILPYIQGRYSNFSAEAAKKKIAAVPGLIGGDTFQIEQGTVDDWTEAIEDANIIGWQFEPAGFRMQNREIGVCMQGTFRLIFGGTYTMENMVVKQVSLVFSKTMTKCPVGAGGKFDGSTVPLYVDLQISFQPAGAIIDTSVTGMVKMSGMEDILRDGSKKRMEALGLSAETETKDTPTEEVKPTGESEAERGVE